MKASNLCEEESHDEEAFCGAGRKIKRHFGDVQKRING